MTETVNPIPKETLLQSKTPTQKAPSMSIPLELYPSQDDLPYEEELLRNPFSLKLWWRYLVARAGSPFKKRAIIYERALKALPGSYKLWYAYLRERLELVRNLPATHSHYQTLNNTFERALVTMHKMPRIWIMYLVSLTEQKLVTRTRRTFDRALCALPVTQHDRIWEHYLVFVSQRGIPIETSLRVYRRYLKYDPSHIEDFIEFLLNSELWQEAAERLAGVLNDDRFYSIKGKTKHRLWLELCDLLTQHATEISGLNVDAIIRGGIKKFTDEVGRLWTSLADYYIRRKLVEKARDIFEEGMTTVVTVRDFSVIFDAYSQFEESMLTLKIEEMSDSDVEEEQSNGEVGTDEDVDEEDNRLDVAKLEKKLRGFWLNDDKDYELREARLEHLLDRRPELANSVLLRQNPHNVEQWHRRVKLFEGNPTKQILTYTEAVRTIDPMKAVGKPHTLWVAFSKLYENHKDIANARVIFDKAVQVNYKTVDHLASVWCEWAEMELRHKNFKGALELMRRATAEPTVEVKRRVAADGNEPVQMKLHKSLRLWLLYVDLEESLGTLESTRAVYERILDLKIATPQIIINYAVLLEDHKYFEDAFKVYERGVKIFKYPHVKDIWVTYLSKFVRRYGKSKLERARELFEHAVEEAPADAVKPLYLQYAKLEEDYGLAKRADYRSTFTREISEMEDIFEHKTVTVNGINMHVVEVGQGPVILFVHGFPELWYSWRHQISFMAKHGYRAVAPDLRGYGDTTGAPKDDPSKFTTLHVVGDLVELLNTIVPEQEKVFVVGHDWGAVIAWYLCLYRPDKVKALVNLSVAFSPRNPKRKPLETLRAVYGEDYYIVRFQEPGKIEAEFAKIGTKKVLEKFLSYRNPGPLILPKGKPFDDSTVILPPWLSEKEVDYFATKYEKSGFTGGLNYYRALDLNWELTAAWTGGKVRVPVKFIVGDLDLTYNAPGVKDYVHKGGMKKDVPLLEEVVILEGVGHFLQQEKPDEINKHILDFFHGFSST